MNKNTFRPRFFLEDVVRQGFYMYAGSWSFSVTYEHLGNFYAAYNAIYIYRQLSEEKCKNFLGRKTV
jgi:hypothetical protein